MDASVEINQASPTQAALYVSCGGSQKRTSNTALEPAVPYSRMYMIQSLKKILAFFVLFTGLIAGMSSLALNRAQSFATG